MHSSAGRVNLISSDPFSHRMKERLIYRLLYDGASE